MLSAPQLHLCLHLQHLEQDEQDISNRIPDLCGLKSTRDSNECFTDREVLSIFCCCCAGPPKQVPQAPHARNAFSTSNGVGSSRGNDRGGGGKPTEERLTGTSDMIHFSYTSMETE